METHTKIVVNLVMKRRFIRGLFFMREKTELCLFNRKSHLIRMQVTCLDWYVQQKYQRLNHDSTSTIKNVNANQDLEFPINKAKVKSIHVPRLFCFCLQQYNVPWA